MSWLRSTVFACCFAASVAAQDLPPAPGKLFDVGSGRRLHLLCGGTGSPSIIIEAGASAFAIDFTLVQRELQKTHRVCSYDRAGSGWSDPLPPYTPAKDAADLHALLQAAKEPAPYVLVGASRGGLLIRGFLNAYPSEVAGLVFIDPATEDRLFGMVDGRPMSIAQMTAEQMRSTIPSQTMRVPKRPVQQGPPFDLLPPELYKQRLLLDERLIAQMPATLTPEQLLAYQESERVFLASLLASRKAGKPFGNRPTIVLARGNDRNEGREQSQRLVGDLSSNSRFSVIAGSGHEIHLFHPRAVVSAVTDVVEAILKKTQLRPE
ncbi:MAG TPA: alpha/beta hydrolase [Vicinamibacterales bacterium]